MNIGQAIASMYQNYANFKGRSRRSAYWFAYLFYAAITMVLSVTTATTNSATGMPENGPVYWIWVLANALPMLAVGVRRMHDVGKSGWFILIPIYNIVLLATEGTKEDNTYGVPAK